MDGSAIVRSYVWGWQVGAYLGWILGETTNPLTVSFTPAPGITQTLHFKIRDNVWDWSSNVYSLDYWVERAWNTYSFIPGEFDTPGYAVWIPDTSLQCPVVLVHAGSPSVYFSGAMPRGPDTYWRGNFPNCP